MNAATAEQLEEIRTQLVVINSDEWTLVHVHAQRNRRISILEDLTQEEADQWLATLNWAVRRMVEEAAA